MNPLLSIFDILLTPLYILGASAYGYYISKKHIRTKPEYAYFTKGLMVRVFGAIALGLIYFFYYGGGDTTNYFQTSSAYAHLMFNDLDDFWIGWLGDAKGHFFNFNVFNIRIKYYPKLTKFYLYDYNIIISYNHHLNYF